MNESGRQLLTDLLSHDTDFLSQMLGYEPDWEIVEELRAWLERERDGTQIALLRWIDTQITESSWAPSVREVSAAFSWKSSATAQHHLDKLENAGLIVRGKQHRQIRLTPRGKALLQVPGHTSPGTDRSLRPPRTGGPVARSNKGEDL